MDQLKAFFLFCSGSYSSIVKRTPSDVNKLCGLGATIFFTGIFAAIAASFALYSVFQNVLVATFFGLIWGLMIFNLDRYIVSSMKKKGRFFGDFFMTLPRIVLAVVIAIVIAKPLELKVFENEIQSELLSMQQEKFKDQEDLIKLRFEARKTTLNGELTVLRSEISDKETLRDQLLAEAIAEADGTGGSMKKNLGPIYKTKKAAADKAEAELALTRQSNSPIIREKELKLDELENEIKAEVATLARKPLNGIAAQLEAQSRLAAESFAIKMAGIFIMLLFILIETSPILLKLISYRSPYDYALNKHEFEFQMNNKRIVALKANAVKNQIRFDKEASAYKTNLAIKAEKELAAQLIRQELEVLKRQPLSWQNFMKKNRIFGAG